MLLKSIPKVQNQRALCIWRTARVGTRMNTADITANPRPAPVIRETDVSVLPVLGNSTRRHLEDVQVKCDIVTMDSQFKEKFASHMRNGGALDINFQSYVNQAQQVVSKGLTIQVMRAFSKLKCLFVTLDNQNCRIQSPIQDIVERGMTKYRSFLNP